MEYELYINGGCVQGEGAEMTVINPASGCEIARVKGADKRQVKAALEAAETAFPSWARCSIQERINWMYKLRDACKKRRDGLIRLLMMEVGKSWAEASRDVDSFLDSALFYAEERKRIYDIGIHDWTNNRGEAFHSVNMYPIGVAVGHIAWNWPLHNLGLKLWPAMVSGCTCILKPSSSTPLSGMLVGAIAEEIGVPAGVFQIVVGPADEVGLYLNESRIPRLITLIGSSEVGRQVMKQASTSIKRFSFELGGNAPCIIMPDADLECAADFIVQRKTFNCGQGCANVNRVFVHRDVHNRLINMLEERLSRVRVGWGEGYESAMGPMINTAARDQILTVIRHAEEQGAIRLFGGRIPGNLPEHLQKGAFITPCLLDAVNDEMEITNVELFGPVISVLQFDTFEEVVRRGNQTQYGLSSYLFTHDSRIIAKAADELAFGEVMINAPSDGIFLPHGGIKESGIGCDRSRWSLEEYFVIKRVSIRP